MKSEKRKEKKILAITPVFSDTQSAGIHSNFKHIFYVFKCCIIVLPIFFSGLFDKYKVQMYSTNKKN